MVYDFSRSINRSELNSHKWANMLKEYPNLPDEIVPFTVADSDFILMDEVRTALHKAIDQIPMGYTYPSSDYYESVINFLKRRHSYCIEKEDILDTLGVIQSIEDIIHTYTLKNDEILVFTPVYTPFMKLCEKHGRTCVEVELVQSSRGYSIDFIQLEEVFKKHRIKILLFCSPHNPVGRVWTVGELSQLAELCLKYDVLIVSDEIHAEIVMSGHQHTMIASLSNEIDEKTITLIAPTKIFNMAGLQGSQMIIKNRQLRAKMINYRKQFNHNRVNLLFNVACTAAYNLGDTYISEFNHLIETNYNMIKTRIESKSPHIKMTELQGTYLCWLDFTDLTMDEEVLLKSLKEESQLFFNPGRIYGTTSGSFIRWNLAYPTQTIERALDRLEKWYLFHVKQ